MKKLSKVFLVILLMFLTLSLSACRSPEPIVLEAMDNIELNDWVDLHIDEDVGKLVGITVSLDDQRIETDYLNEDDNVIKFKSRSGFSPSSQYELIATYNKGQTYHLTFNTLSRLDQVLLNIERDFFIMPAQGDYDVEEAEKMKARILKISPKILLSLYRADVRMKLTNAPITEEPELQYLQGQVPRGWEYTNMTWDDVPGAGGYDLPIARIGHSDPSIENNHDTINLELHEIAHTVDNYITGEVSDAVSFTDDFVYAWESEVYSVLPYDYFINYIEEYFAEVFAMYYLNEESHQRLLDYAPLTYAFIADLDKFTQIKDFD